MILRGVNFFSYYRVFHYQDALFDLEFHQLLNRTTFFPQNKQIAVPIDWSAERTTERAKESTAQRNDSAETATASRSARHSKFPQTQKSPDEHNIPHKTNSATVQTKIPFGPVSVPSAIPLCSPRQGRLAARPENWHWPPEAVVVPALFLAQVALSPCVPLRWLRRPSAQRYLWSARSGTQRKQRQSRECWCGFLASPSVSRLALLAWCSWCSIRLWHGCNVRKRC